MAINHSKDDDKPCDKLIFRLGYSLFSDKPQTFAVHWRKLHPQMEKIAYKKYQEMISHPLDPV
jgi:isopentenyl phosphate kinase